MSLFELFLLAFALGIDCLAVSFSQGLCYKKNIICNSLSLAAIMGGFQAFMPMMSYFLADVVSKYLEAFASSIVFLIFMFLGVKIIIEAFSVESKQEVCDISFKRKMILGIVTSVDALCAGVSLKFTENDIILSCLSVCGFFIGWKFKCFSPKVLFIFAGLILFGLAVKSVF